MTELRRFRLCPFDGTALAETDESGTTRPTCPECGFRQYGNPVPAVNAIVVRADHLLLVKRGHDPHAGEWALPGGFVEWDEDPADTVLRECKEETGVSVGVTGDPWVLVDHGDPRGNMLTINYPCEPVREGLPEAVAGDDAAEAVWMPVGEIPRLAFENHEDIVRRLGFRN